MKLLVFAHTPPPHHGQSYMVKLMLDGFGGDCRKRKGNPPDSFGIECYHVNARFSKNLEDVGEFQGAKIFLILFYCAQAIWLRFRHGIENFYYVPAPGKHIALYRDWLILLFCRPFFKRIILHWHAAGLAKWLETSVQIRARALTYRLFKPVDLSIVLSNYNIADAEKLLSCRICVVSNGIPDPCPDFAETILPRRRARFSARKKLLDGKTPEASELEQTGDDSETINVLFLAHCTREKGLFTAMESVVLTNRDLTARQSPLRMKLFVAGNFVSEDEKAEFDRLLLQREFADAVNYLGFVSDDKKSHALREADLFCFPTHYHAESFGLVAVEAMAFGLPIAVTRWRSLPEIFPPDYSGIVTSQSAREVADTLLKFIVTNDGERLRDHFLNHFVLQSHLEKLAEAIHSVENQSQMNKD